MSNGHDRENDMFAGKIGYKAKRAMERASAENGAAGTMVGYYDEALTVLTASGDLLNSLGYSHGDYQSFTGGSLRRLLREEIARTITPQAWKAVRSGETAFVTGSGSLVPVWLCKVDSVDGAGTPVWVVSVRVVWELEQLTQVSQAIGVGSWQMDCSAGGSVTQVQWSHAFRRILGYQDVLDFPNSFESWMDILHAQDCDVVLGRLAAAIWGRKDQPQFSVQCRLKRKDGSWGWFRMTAEITRSPDGAASHIAGVLIDIDGEVQAAAQLSDAVYRQEALTNGDNVEHLIQKMSTMVSRFAVCDLENDQYGHVAMSPKGDYPFAGKYSDFVRLVAQKFKTLPPMDALTVMMSPEKFRQKLRTAGDVLKFEYCSLDGDDHRLATVVPLDWEKGVLTKVLCTSADITK